MSPIDVTGVTLDPTALSLIVGAAQSLVATVAPADATNQGVTWSSDNTSVATVDATGKITAVGIGTAKIMVTTVDGNKTASCAVTVIPNPTLIVTVDMFKNSSNGKTIISIPNTVTELKLPWNVVTLLGKNKLEVDSDTFKLDIPTDLITQVTSTVPQDVLTSSVISLKIRPLAASEIEKDKGNFKHAGQAYEITLSVITADGKAAGSSTIPVNSYSSHLQSDGPECHSREWHSGSYIHIKVRGNSCIGVNLYCEYLYAF